MFPAESGTMARHIGMILGKCFLEVLYTNGFFMIGVCESWMPSFLPVITPYRKFSIEFAR